LKRQISGNKLLRELDSMTGESEKISHDGEAVEEISLVDGRVLGLGGGGGSSSSSGGGSSGSVSGSSSVVSLQFDVRDSNDSRATFEKKHGGDKTPLAI
tara:strand:- start:140 stop:436 length:297 start_codon:yes stop_codon:yes gene_type:complete